MKYYFLFVACLFFISTATAHDLSQDPKQEDVSSDQVVYDGQIKRLAVAPVFKKKGFDKYQQWVFSRITYPADLKAAEVQGMVILKIVVEIDGTVSIAEVIESPAQALTDVVAQVIESSPKWSPGMMSDPQSGTLFPVRVSYRLPVEFKIEDPALGGGVTGRWQSNKNVRSYGSN